MHALDTMAKQRPPGILESVVRPKHKRGGSDFFGFLFPGLDDLCSSTPSNAHTIPSFEVGSECWNELAASAVVRVTTKVERVLPAMLTELYRLTVDVIIAEAKKRDREGKETFTEAILAMFPGAMISGPATAKNLELLFMRT
jgi:hypothetical protein